jgi:hypothetical protein
MEPSDVHFINGDGSSPASTGSAMSLPSMWSPALMRAMLRKPPSMRMPVDAPEHHRSAEMNRNQSQNFLSRADETF